VARMRAPSYAWLQPSEGIVYVTTRHWMVPARALCWPTVGLTLVWGTLYGLGRGGVHIPQTAWFVPGGLYLLAFIWHLLDWRNDYFAITSQRFLHRERVSLWFESRHEAPLDRIQNVSVQRNALGALLGYGDLTVETAAQGGRLQFARIPWPEQVRETLFEEVTRARAAERARERIRVRAALVRHLAEAHGRGAHPSPPDSTSADDDLLYDSLEARLATTGVQPMSDVMALQAHRRPLREPDRPAGSPAVAEAVWRRHWFFLLRAVARPLGLVLGCVLLGWATGPGPVSGIGRALPLVPQLLVGLALAPGLWAVWEAVDWANDRYVITEQRIVHVERRPLLASEHRQEASLSVVQNVTLQVPGFWAGVLGYGDVVVQTAGSGEFVFRQVPEPRSVQQEVFRRIEASRAADQLQQVALRRDEFVHWIAAYEDLHPAEGAAGRSQPPQSVPPSSAEYPLP
jgi:uncharacterized membrane protein YdbT with pleckstrin-like domain